MKVLSIVLLSLIVGCSSKSDKKTSETPALKTPQIIFTITEGIAHPESAIYSVDNKAIYISNVASGNPLETKRLGHIGKYSSDGKLIKSPWIKGLKAPKGMTIVGNHLYVTDVNQVVKIDIKKGRIVKTISVKGAKFLNDVISDAHGNVYISDMMTDTIHIWDKKGLRVWMQTPALRSPNGLYTDGKAHILLASWGNPIDAATFATQTPGALSALSLTKVNESVNEEKSISGNLDGITVDNAGNLWISDWMNGDVYQVKKNGSAQKIYNMGQGTADIAFAKELNLLLVPQMNQSKVFALKVD